MDEISKITVLDRCIDGNLTKMNKLLDCNSDQFDTFYELCRDVDPKAVKDIEFSTLGDMGDKVSFTIKLNKSKATKPLFKEVNHNDVEIIPDGIQSVDVIIPVHYNHNSLRKNKREVTPYYESMVGKL